MDSKTRNIIKTYKVEPQEENLRFGFELETQATDGYTKEDTIESEQLSAEEYEEMINNKVDTFLDCPIITIADRVSDTSIVETLLRLIPCVKDLGSADWTFPTDLDDLIDKLFVAQGITMLDNPNQAPNWNVSNTITTETQDFIFYKQDDKETTNVKRIRLSKLLKESYSVRELLVVPELGIDSEKVKIAIGSAWSNANPIDSFGESQDSLSYFKDMVKNKPNSLLQFGSDGTVDGFEIRTQGPLSEDNIKKGISEVFGDFDHEIDDHCSFHIHISEDGISQQYTEVFQTLMLAYIVNHMDEVPESVQERWRNTEWVRDYFTFDTSRRDKDNKYLFIAYRGTYGTWEFRCWGNIDNITDANICLSLTKGAYLYARHIIYNALQDSSNLEDLLKCPSIVSLKYAFYSRLEDMDTAKQALFG